MLKALWSMSLGVLANFSLIAITPISSIERSILFIANKSYSVLSPAYPKSSFSEKASDTNIIYFIIDKTITFGLCSLEERCWLVPLRSYMEMTSDWFEGLVCFTNLKDVSHPPILWEKLFCPNRAVILHVNLDWIKIYLAITVDYISSGVSVEGSVMELPELRTWHHPVIFRSVKVS